MSVAEISDGKNLEPFLKLLESSNDPISVIKQALSAPRVFVFGELLYAKPIQDLQNGSEISKAYYELLKIFAYGTYKDYKANNSMPELTPQQLFKLKQLTVMSLATRTRSISYSDLQENLSISSVRDLEDLIIECIYQGLCTGKLNPAEGIFQVDEIFGRDVPFSELQNISQILERWYNNSTLLLEYTGERINWSELKYQESRKNRVVFEQKCQELASKMSESIEVMINSFHQLGSSPRNTFPRNVTSPKHRDQ